MKSVWHLIGEDLEGEPREPKMTVLAWALFDRWRSVWAAAA